MSALHLESLHQKARQLQASLGEGRNPNRTIIFHNEFSTQPAGLVDSVSVRTSDDFLDGGREERPDQSGDFQMSRFIAFISVEQAMRIITLQREIRLSHTDTRPSLQVLDTREVAVGATHFCGEQRRLQVFAKPNKRELCIEHELTCSETAAVNHFMGRILVRAIYDVATMELTGVEVRIHDATAMDDAGTSMSPLQRGDEQNQVLHGVWRDTVVHKFRNLEITMPICFPSAITDAVLSQHISPFQSAFETTFKVTL